jgi:tetratricopeptide (TPR) repeat protein
MKILLLLLAGASFVVSQTVAQAPAQAAALQADAFYRQGQAAEKAGDPTAAQQAYSAALKADPKHANARYRLAEVKLNASAIAAKGREAKFGSVMIPAFRLDAVSLQEALEALRVLVEKQSNNEVTPNFVIQDPSKQLAAAKISLNLKNLPAKGVLRYLLEQSRAVARHDPYAIVIIPLEP